MNQNNAAPDKTIVCTLDDTYRMIDFCKENGAVSKDFYDWYLMAPAFFTQRGLLIIDMDRGSLAFDEYYKVKAEEYNAPREVREVNQVNKIAVSFDFTDPDYVQFIWYGYKRQLPICKFYFNRQENLTMNDVSFDIEYESLKMLSSDGVLHMRKSDLDDIAKRAHDAGVKAAKQKAGKLIMDKIAVLKETTARTIRETLEAQCTMIIYSTYALMYFISKQQPEEVTTMFNRETDTGNKIKSIYKYTGYVDLRKNKVYRPLIKRDPDEPAREYQRHIDKWIVRGHYRNTKKGKIWIEEHTKGEGELEKRIYSTEDEKDLNLIPKVFEVERATNQSQATAETIVMSVDRPPANPSPWRNKLFDSSIATRAKAELDKIKGPLLMDLSASLDRQFNLLFKNINDVTKP